MKLSYLDGLLICQNYLRQRVYGIEIKELTKHGESAHLGMLASSLIRPIKCHSTKNWLIVHCIDYLRQVLMCHGDLTPITLAYDIKENFVKPDFRIKHTCRDFESIWNFAAKGNRSGISIEG